MPMTLEEMRDIDVRTVDPSTLVDISTVSFNMELPEDKRQIDYLGQVKNPYCFKLGKGVVKVSFSDTESTIEDCLERYLLSL